MTDWLEDNEALPANAVEVTAKPAALAEVSWWGSDRINKVNRALASLRSGLRTGAGIKLRGVNSLIPSSAGEVSFGSIGGRFAKNENGGPDVDVSRWTTVVASASAGALSISPVGDTVAFITLDANLTINNPTPSGFANSAKAGVHLVLNFAQDSTGYRTVAFGGNVKADFLIPRQGPGQNSSIHLVQRADGTWRVVSHDAINIRQELQASDFGAKGNAASLTDTSVDDTVALQKMVDTSLYLGVKQPCRLGSRHRITAPLQIGWGDFVKSGFVLKGLGVDYRGEGRNGSAILCDFSNGPGIAINSSYNCRLEDFALVGKLTGWVASNRLCNNAALGETAAAIDDTVGSNWVDPSLDANQDSRYSPYAGIVEDGYRGSKPSPAYPDRTYPSYTGLSAQYGAGISSGNRVRNVHVMGFNTGIALMPSDADGNGDFFGLESATIELCKYGLSVGNTQSRNVNLSKVNFNQLFCAWTNNTHGMQSGKLGGTWTDISVSRVINLFKLGSTSIAGPLSISTLYAENLWRLGDYTETTSAALSFHFSSCQFLLDLQRDTSRGCSATVLGSSNQPSGLRFTDCDFAGFPSVLHLDNPEMVMDRCRVAPASRDTGVSSAYQAFAHNALAGGLVLPRLSGKGVRNARAVVFNVNTSTPASNVVMGDDFMATDRTTCVPLYARSCLPSAADYRTPLLSPQLKGRAWDKSSGGGSIDSITLSGLEMTINLNSGYAPYSYQWGMQPGDVWLDQDSGTVFFVRSRTGNAVIGVAQNNYKGTTTAAFINPVSTSSGTLYAVCSRIYTPPHAIFADFASPSATLANAQWANGYGGAVSSELAVGDRLFVDDNSDDFPFFGVPPKINSFGSGSIVLDGGSARSQLGKRLTWLFRAPPANA